MKIELVVTATQKNLDWTKRFCQLLELEVENDGLLIESFEEWIDLACGILGDQGRAGFSKMLRDRISAIEGWDKS